MTEVPPIPPLIVAPTQVKFPGRAVARTVVATLVTAVTLVNLVLPIILDIVNKNFTGKIAIWVNSAAVTVSIITGAVTRIMAIPQVDHYLASLKLSAAK